MKSKRLVLAPFLLSACSHEPPTAPPGPPSAKSGAAISPSLLERICQTEHTDGSSTVFSALGPEGDVRRLVVTPSRRIADMGNLVFDMDGHLLGHDTGSEVPWDDRAFMEKERERVSALMGGAQIPNGREPARCEVIRAQ